MFEGRQAQFASDPYDFCLVHAPRLDLVSDKLGTSKTLCAHGQRLAVDILDLSIVRFDFSDELSQLSLDCRIARLQLCGQFVTLSLDFLISDPPPLILFLRSDFLEPIALAATPPFAIVRAGMPRHPFRAELR